jgi:hypothetical protein
MSRPLILYERLVVPAGSVGYTQNPNFQIRPPDKYKVDWMWFDTLVPPFQNWNNWLLKIRRLSRRQFNNRRIAIPAWHNIPREFSPWAWQWLLREPYRVGPHESFAITIVNPTTVELEFTISFHCVGVESGDNRILTAAVNIAAANPAAGVPAVRQQFGDRDTANDGIEPLLLRKVSIEPVIQRPGLINPREVLMQIKPSEDIAWSDDPIPMLAYFPDVGPYGHFFKPNGEIIMEMMDGLEFEVENAGTPQTPDYIHIAVAGHILTQAETVSGDES